MIIQPKTEFSQLDDLLNRIGKNIQLDPSRRENVETSYKNVTKLFQNEPYFNNVDVDIFPHGSFRIETSVKPKMDDEFDLDFVLLIHKNLMGMSPSVILQFIHDILESNGMYKGKVSIHKRCVRINYANEFHMDIMPAFPSAFNNNVIFIPDKELRKWIESSPEGFAKWFESKYLSGSKFWEFIEKSARVEPLPAQSNYNRLQPLQRAVQLMKRYRNIYFREIDEKFFLKSIILTTLTAEAYNFSYSVSDTITNVLNNIQNKIDENFYQPFDVSNPILTSEIFSKKWYEDDDVFEHFTSFIYEFNEKWSEMLNTSSTQKFDLVYVLFGESITKTAMFEQAKFMEFSKDTNGLHSIKSTGILTPFSSELTKHHPKNTNFGN